MLIFNLFSHQDIFSLDAVKYLLYLPQILFWVTMKIIIFSFWKLNMDILLTLTRNGEFRYEAPVQWRDAPRADETAPASRSHDARNVLPQTLPTDVPRNANKCSPRTGEGVLIEPSPLPITYQSSIIRFSYL